MRPESFISLSRKFHTFQLNSCLHDLMLSTLGCTKLDFLTDLPLHQTSCIVINVKNLR